MHGLPAGRGEQPDMTTARDMATLGRALLVHPEALFWSSQATAPFRDGKFTLYNPNKLVGKYRGLDGLKTGYHGQAGFCVTATAIQKDVRLLSVVMGCPTDRSRATETTRLLSYGFNLFRKVTVIPDAGTPVPERVAMEGGKQADLGLVYAERLEVSVPQEREGDIEMRRELVEPVTAPVAEGEKVGEVVAVLDGFELGRVDLLAAETVEKGNWFNRLFH